MRKQNIKSLIFIVAVLLSVLSFFTFSSSSMAQTPSDETPEWVDLWFDGNPVTTYDSSIIPGLADAEHSHIACIVHFDESGNAIEGKWFVVTKDMEAVTNDIFHEKEMQGVKPIPTPPGQQLIPIIPRQLVK
jgi:hypothetical protein